MAKSHHFANGPEATSGNSSLNGPDTLIPVLHSEFCACSWCLQGVR